MSKDTGDRTNLRWNSRDLDFFPDNNGKRYEIVDGELYVSDPTRWDHQLVCTHLCFALATWSDGTKIGQAVPAPGLIFSEENDVAPDVVWISRERLATALWPDGMLHSAPELIAEVLLLGEANERRDREIKLELYSRRGVSEYWIVSWQERSIEVYRREHAALKFDRTLYHDDVLESSLPPGFSCHLKEIFAGI